jgi:hypothetical protein
MALVATKIQTVAPGLGAICGTVLVYEGVAALRTMFFIASLGVYDLVERRAAE